MQMSEFNKVYRNNYENGATNGLRVNEKYWAYLLLLFQEGFDMTPEERNEWVSMLCEEYYGECGKYPPERMLACMSDLLLYDSLKDKASHKVKYEHYTILSANQLKRRYSREFSAVAETIEFFHAKDCYQFATKKKTQNIDSETMDYAYKHQSI